MNKTVCLLLLSVLIAAFLFGCSGDESNNTVPSAPRETVDPRIYEIMDSLPGIEVKTPEDRLLAETDIFTLSRKNGHCYLNFKSGNHKIILNIDEKDSCGHAIYFDSVDEMYRWLLAPEISPETEEAIRHCTPLDENNGFLLPDPDHLYTLSIPDEYKLERAFIHGAEYALIYKMRSPSASGCYGGVHMRTISKDEFASKLEQYYRFRHGNTAYNSSYVIDEKDAIAYEYETEVWMFRDVQYCLQTEGMTLFVEENYLISKDDPADSEYHFAGVEILGYKDGLYFTLNRHYSDPQPLIDLLDDLKVVKYAP